MAAIETVAVMFFRKRRRGRIGRCIRGHPTFPRSPVLQ
jgi:hypothetical protein